MYAVWSMVPLGPGKRATAENICDQFAPFIRAQEGCREALFMYNDTTGELASLSRWESQELAEAGVATIDAQTQHAVKEIAVGPMSRHFFEEHEPSVLVTEPR